MILVGISALPIIATLSFTIGIMLAIQGIHTLETFGAQEQVVLGIALSVTRKFAPLIVAILVAGRSGSAFAARIATMVISQEIDALRVIGINPVRPP
ncbi:MAG: ABC transporter permease [Sedimenticola sp.]